MDQLPSLGIEHSRLGGTNAFPFFDGFSQRAVYRFGKGCVGLADWDIEKTNCLSARRICARIMPADALYSQSADLVPAKPRKEPDESKGSNHLYRVSVPSGRRAGEIALLKIQSTPQQLGPNVVSNHSRIGSD